MDNTLRDATARMRLPLRWRVFAAALPLVFALGTSGFGSGLRGGPVEAVATEQNQHGQDGQQVETGVLGAPAPQKQNKEEANRAEQKTPQPLPGITTETGQLQLQGGQNANAADTPWVAYIRTTNRDGTTGMNCSGALINTSWVITARHCVSNNPSAINVALGAERIGNKAVSTYSVHPQADVALLHLLTPASGVEPITVAASPALNGQNGIFYGWGGSHTTLQAGVHRVEQQCSASINGPNATDFQAFCPPQAGQMLTYKTTGNASRTESGDSGGPLVVGGKLVGTLVGGTQSGSYFIKLQELAPFLESTAQIKLGVKPNPIFEYAYESRVGRIAGINRVDTALSLFSAATYPGDSVILTTGMLAPDALGASALVGATNAPILLTNAPQVEQSVVDAILRSGKKHLYVVGGQVHFHPNHEAQLRSAGVQIHRIAGADRYETTVAVAKLAQSLAPAPKQLDVFLVDAAYDPNVPDALSVGPVVANNQAVVLYTNRFTLPTATSRALKELAGQAKQQGKTVRLYLVGGWAKGAAAQAGIIANPAAWSIDDMAALSGTDRYATSAQVVTTFGAGFKQFLVASGQSFADGLSSCGYAKQVNAAILLSAPNQLPGSTAALISQRPQASYTLVGGFVALSRGVANSVGELLTR